MTLLGSTLFLLLSTLVLADRKAYEGFKVYRIQPIGKTQLRALTENADNAELDFWSPLRKDGQVTTVMVSPKGQSWFENLLENNFINHEVQIENVTEALKEETENQGIETRSGRRGITFNEYHRHPEMNDYLERLQLSHPELVTVETIGQSYEGRDLKVIKISTDPSAKKPVIFMDAGIHAREWIAPTVALYTIHKLVEDEANLDLLENVDWHILPLLNPDGYEYTHEREKNRFWRKTRKPNENSKCKGVDANRNYAYHWAEIGSSDDECRQTFHGPQAFSEPETKAVRDYILSNKDRIKLYLTVHSYGELLLYPWGFTEDLPDNHKELQALGDAVAESIEAYNGTRYTVGSVTEVLVAGAGGADDWAKGGAGIDLSYTIELPGGGSWGFDPPSSRILPIVRETWEGLKTFNNYIATKFS